MTFTDDLPWYLRPPALLIWAAWLVVALAYTPPLMLMGGGPTSQSLDPVAAFLFVLLGFVPWALATPLLLSLSWKAPLGSNKNLRSLLLIGATALIALPLLSLTGTILAQSFMGFMALGQIDLDPERIGRASLINGFFSVPTYVAVIGVGQTLVYVERTRTRERLLARARLEALRAQINPHFLFNALGAIAQLAHKDPGTAELAISRLADVLRTSLASDVETVSLSEEIGTVMDHIELHRMLLASPLDLTVSVTPIAWAAQVPAMILQPLVENAVTHGLARMTSGLSLSIKADALRDRLVIEVSNSLPVEAHESRGLGLGLANVRERLAALYGDAGRLETSADNGSFAVTLGLPLMKTATEAEVRP